MSDISHVHDVLLMFWRSDTLLSYSNVALLPAKPPSLRLIDSLALGDALTLAIAGQDPPGCSESLHLSSAF